jgi:hypothetical protein
MLTQEEFASLLTVEDRNRTGPARPLERIQRPLYDIV